MKLPHRSVILVGTAVAFSLFGDMTIYAVLPTHFENLGLTPFQVGILLSSNRWVRLVTNHVAERITRKIHPGILLTGSLMLSSLLAAVYALAPPFILFLAARLFWGLCWSFLRQIGTMTAVTRANEKNVGQIIGVYNSIVRFGFILGSIFGGIFFDLFGYRLAFFLFAGVILLGIPFAVSGLSGEENRRIDLKSGERSQKRLSPTIMFRGFAVGCVGSGIIMSTLGLILNDRLGKIVTLGQLAIGVATLNGILLASRQILGIIGAPFLGALLDRVGVAKAERYIFLSATAALFLAGLFPEAIVLLLLVIFFFICETTLRIALTVESGRKGSRAYALLSTATDAGAAFGPLLAWTVFDFISSSAVIFFVAGVLYAVSTLFSFRSTHSYVDTNQTSPR